MKRQADRAPWTAALLRLYPRSWQARYRDEVLDLVVAEPPSLRLAADLLRGALDARLHGPRPSRWPALAAIAGGAIWIVAGLGVAAQPVPPDWPGYLLEVVPLAMLGVALVLLAVAGAWLRVGDGASGLDTLAVDVAVAGHLAWLLALLAVLANVDYTAAVVLATGVAMTGTSLVGATLGRSGDRLIASLLIAAAVVMLAPAVLPLAAALGWVGFGAAWSAIGVVTLVEAIRPLPAGPGVVSLP